MLGKLVIAVVVGVFTAIVCRLVGGLLLGFKEDFALTIGQWLKDNASLIGLLVGLLEFFGSPVVTKHLNRD